MGSVLGPWGAAGGAVLGGTLGVLGGGSQGKATPSQNPNPSHPGQSIQSALPPAPTAVSGGSSSSGSGSQQQLMALLAMLKKGGMGGILG